MRRNVFFTSGNTLEIISGDVPNVVRNNTRYIWILAYYQAGWI
jgi:hypothetical protein